MFLGRLDNRGIIRGRGSAFLFPPALQMLFVVLESVYDILGGFLVGDVAGHMQFLYIS